LGLFLCNIVAPINKTMNNKITFLIALLFSLIFNASYAQDGANDPTFNPTDTGYGNGTNAPVQVVTLQLDGKILIGGEFTYYTGLSRNHITRLNADQTLDTSFDPGTGINNTIKSIVMQPDGKILIGGTFTQYNGVARNGIARINSDGSLDETFNPGEGAEGADYEAYGTVNTIALQADGKILIGGHFISYNGAAVNNFVRLNADGSLDTTFVSTGSNDTVAKIVLQQDGKIIVGGFFRQFNNINILNGICRLNTDGSSDSGFSITWTSNLLAYTMALQPDGKILLGGNYYYLLGNSYIGGNLCRLNTDGSLDVNFNIINSGDISNIIVQPDGKILASGYMVLTGENFSRNFLRFNNDGSRDMDFTANVSRYDYFVASKANSFALQPDGKIIIGGNFLSYNGVSKNHLIRVESNGDVDAGFTLGNGTGADNTIETSLIQPDGKIIIAGAFTYFNGQVSRSIARLYPDGDVDTTFNSAAGAEGPIQLSALQPDGKIIVLGEFTAYNGTEVNKVARINNDGTLDTSFTLDSAISMLTPFGVTVQPNGKILISALVNYNNGTDILYMYTVFRLNADGTLDTTFEITDGRPSRNMIVLENGKIMAAYTYFYSNIGSQLTIVRLNSNGTLDNTFQTVNYDSVERVDAMAIQPDGKVIISGYNSYNQENPTAELVKFLRLNTDGTVDTTFNNVIVANKMVVQQDGKIIIAAGISSNNTGYNLARLNTDGSYDDTFNAGTGLGFYGKITGLHLQPGGKLLITGNFNEYNGAGRNRIARVMSSGSLGTNTPDAVSNNVIAYKSNNALQITSSNQVIKSVQVYDLAGRLLSVSENVNAVNTFIEDLAASRKILVVNIKLADGTSVSKKLYY